MKIEDCIDKGFLKRSGPDPDLSVKELKEAEYDLEKAKKAFEQQDYKWSIVKCYYSMFHAAKSVLFNLGYVEKRHIAVLVVLEHLHRMGRLESRYVIDYKAALSAREDADYHYSYPIEVAKYELDNAKDFFDAMKALLKK